jgi:hypothetical protein
MVTKETHRGVISRPFTVLYFIPCGPDFLSKNFHTIFLVIYFKLKDCGFTDPLVYLESII